MLPCNTLINVIKNLSKNGMGNVQRVGAASIFQPFTVSGLTVMNMCNTHSVGLLLSSVPEALVMLQMVISVIVCA